MTALLEKPTPLPSFEPARIDRHAVRFLMDHKLGRLISEDLTTGEPLVTSVHYVPDADGSLLTLIPADSDLADAIRLGTQGMLSVQSRHDHVDRDATDAFGTPNAAAIWHVQATAEMTLIKEEGAVRDILGRQIASILGGLEQGAEENPVDRIGRSALNQLVGVRLRFIAVHPKLRASE